MIIEYQKRTNLLDNTPNQPSKFKTKNWVEKNNESRRSYNEDNQIIFKTPMLRSGLCDYRDTYILVKRTIIVAEVIAAAPNNANKKVIIKNCVPFTNCISRINNALVHDPHDIDVVLPIYNLI